MGGHTGVPGRLFNHCGLKLRLASGGAPVRGFQFMTPDERRTLQARAAKAMALKRDNGRADAKLRKF